MFVPRRRCCLGSQSFSSHEVIVTIALATCFKLMRVATLMIVMNMITLLEVHAV